MSATTVGTAATSTAWASAWEGALAALEMDVHEAEQMLALDHLAVVPAVRPWSPPQGLGPLPTSLEERARALLGRQVETARRLAEAAELSRRHSRAAQALRQSAPSVPVYLDTPA